uniref:Cytochrome b n=7 Tax=Heterorhabditis TaxID=37861 RepID=A0A310_HETBA|nr:cytochrome b [Heterorhabditis indica]YP_817457.1 cytochrome b [Heterorhabditis bacteriophora]ABJ80701.1 cytochrome b [Heterorhabditis bacteriophora]AZU95942.1 cytochrome b [Heterorhabditis bacteriophora]QAA11087.1 cytochrome b [Heterorhabditis indica]QAA11099.1 cytochrome b [Heterorhabditis bacteriophora]
MKFNNNVFNFVNSLVVSLPSSKTLTLSWNFGSMLGMILLFQIITGTFLAFYYTPDSNLAFSSVQYIMYEVNFGWLFRIFHFNGASLFFIFLYLHIFKGLFFMSYRLSKVWMSGLTLYLLIMMEAFMGYVLVWAQMSFWAAVVITSLLSVIPIWGPTIVIWIWSGFGVTGATLKFFFVLHFLVPWGLLVLVLLHLVFLHDTGSTSSLYCHGDYDKVCFAPEYWGKDAYNVIMWLLFFMFSLIYPFILGDPEMFIEADPMMSPVHIVPEWYFLFAYAILRAIPNKILGVLALLMSIVLFYFFAFINNYTSCMTVLNKFLVFSFIVVSVVLSWLGQCVVEEPFATLSYLFSIFYFSLVMIMLLVFMFSKLIFK